MISHITNFVLGLLFLLCGCSIAKFPVHGPGRAFNPCNEAPFVRGTCYANLLRFSFVNGKCYPFYYGGCDGTGNNFETIQQCEIQCGVDRCDQTPGIAGRCYAYFRRYTYVPQVDACFPFIYGGCEGNHNNFLDEISCRDRCVGRRGPFIGRPYFG